MKKILILYTSIGLGHKSIAQNIGKRLEDAGCTVKLEDILQVQGGVLVEISKRIHHLFSVTFPFLWSFFYKSEWFTKISLPWRTKVAARNFQNTKLVIDGFDPDIIITTQTSASAIIAYLKEKGIYKNLFGIAFSDFHFHQYWLYDEADFYLVNIEEQKRQMEELGVQREKIFVCGMTLSPKKEVNIIEVKKKFDIKESDKVILVSSGSLGTGISKELLKSLSSHEHRHIIVVCGKNKKAYEALENYFIGSNVTILGFHSPMDELYAIADIFITKPGGLSVSEALRWNLPVLVSHMLPGQEELNFEYLEDKGLVMPEPINIEGETLDELESGSFRQRLQANPAKEDLFPKIDVTQALEEIINGTYKE